MRAKELGNFLFACFAHCHGQSDFIDPALRGINFDTVEIEEDHRGNDTCAFIAIQEWMVLDYVEQVSGGHFKKILVEKLTIECCLRLGNGRIKHAYITHAVVAAVQGNLIGMETQHFFQIKKVRHENYSARRFRSSPNFWLILSRDARSFC